MKKLIVPIKKINGKISNKTDGMFNSVKKIGVVKAIVISLKKVISSRIFKIVTKQKKKAPTLNIFLRNILIIFFL
tara:strand:+ start:951 stop:1175 length:225 start_codon:yes stop_codon:yes gene_type:complete